MRLRCLVKRASDGAYCHSFAGHEAGSLFPSHGGEGTTLWHLEDCAPGAGPNGRETAALRILEVSHEIDRLMFLAGEHSTDAVRAIAARLMTGTQAAKLDLSCIETWLTMNEGAAGCHELLRNAADLLRPFAS